MDTMPATTFSPELLAPAGDMARLDAVLRYGADAVYLGGTEMNLRAGASGFTPEALGIALAKAHSCGAKIYCCVNALPYEHQLKTMQATLERLAQPFFCNQEQLEPQWRSADAPANGEYRISGLIIADPGVLRMARRIAPHIPVHLSTQANTANSESAAFWRDIGASRLNLARELGAADIKAIMRAVPDVEYETFVHGAMCLAVSGRCLLSAWMNDRPANLGQCTHPCRFDYRTASVECSDQESGFGGIEVDFEERTRKGAPAWTVTEDDGWSHIWSPHDLCLVRYLRWFAMQGVAALKIEGRMKTAGYAAQVVDVYRAAIDDLAAGRYRPDLYMAELRNTATRPLSSGFFLPSGRRKTWPAATKEERLPLVARIIGQHNDDAWEVAVLAPWHASTSVHILAPGLNRPELAQTGYGVENHKGELAQTVHPGTKAVLRCGHKDLAAGLFLRAANPA
ncbi:peptidase U32 family protein [Oleidesulfovibrio sp.]|uniref:peptidase U32 family protein n=1 Tax=Oleidesulfovibrio sp. TaxID=2909707 RepID=UPI003A83A486